MRVLMASQMVPYLPCHDGFRVIPGHLLRCLSARHEFHLVALADGSEDMEQLEWPKHHCRSVDVVRNPREGLNGRRRPAELSEGAAGLIRERLRALRPDVLHLEGPAMAPLARLATGGTRTLLSAHDALSLRYREFARSARSLRSFALYRLRALRARRFERRELGGIGRVVVTAPADQQALQACVPRERLIVIPNGVDLEYLQFRPAPQPGRIVFTGNMSWPPNEDAARYFALEVFPLVQEKQPHAEFWIVGAAPSERVRALGERRGVHVTGTVPDLREWIWSASVYVSPLRFGAGVKNKILEAMALGAPLVASPPSLTGTPLERGREALVAEDGPGLAESVLALLADPERAQALARAARQRVEADYSWESIAERFVQAWGVRDAEVAAQEVAR